MIKYKIPNFLTVLRGLLTLAIILLFFIDFDNKFWLILILFLTASLTDFFDGYLARRWEVVTDFGRIFDPLFDKVLIFSLYFLLIPNLGSSLSAIFILLMIRDIVTDGLKSYLLSVGEVTPAIFSAKLKTTSQFLMIACALLFIAFSQRLAILSAMTHVLAILSLVFSYYSGAIYLKKFLRYF